MTSEEIIKLMDYGMDEYGEFSRIPQEEKLAENDDVCAILYLYNHLKDKSKFEIAAEHDILYLPSIDDLVELTKEDILYLDRCGIHFDEEFDCFAIFT